ncbi:heat shock protein 40 [Thecamonas trahens ATCC 50062]|uniref:Heat shock protein 40 n=1 Tax=Thecamonas trahens ATCC 50062 TaxID=461836 RepID=A0A0L0DKE4_THETB|nr:heat shock protein 40 [Thecamonas trahens ATCC 50062]KNC52675.1 heat shock protein 40 [Thecamonas trahens ATCC 50062]|eukprot:XP_013755224.1 heat shock protein 40 [Thecamonas trahens ATCC 50062]
MDYYAVLGVARDATDAELKKAYRKAAIKWHPRKNAESEEEAEVAFAEAAEAYEVLSMPVLRAVFDQYGETGLKEGIPDGGGDIPGFDGYTFSGDPYAVFTKMFGGEAPFALFADPLNGPAKSSVFGAGAVARSPVKPATDLHTLRLTLEQLYAGCTKKIKITRRVLNSDGQTTREQATVLTVPIKPGFKAGTRITFAGQGDQGPGMEPGDVVFVVAEKPHKVFARNGNDLVYTATVSLLHALTGFTVELTTLDNRRLAIPINDVVEPGFSKKVHGEGMPLPGTPGARGDLYIKFTVVFPNNLNGKQKNHIRAALGPPPKSQPAKLPGKSSS